MDMELVVWCIVLVLMVVALVSACVGVCMYVYQQEMEYHEYGGVVHHAATMDALRDAVEEDGLWY